jgi:hypothetical protein
MNNNLNKDFKTVINITADTITGTTSNTTAELKLTDSTVSYNCFNEWSPWSGSNKCPKCGSTHIEVNNYITLTTYPAQSQLRCQDCGYQFGSGIFSRNTNEDSLDDYWKHDQSILNIPKVGDWPPGPQVGDAPWWPSEQELPSYPDIYIPEKDSPVGWVCPKCGRCWAPHVRGCSNCNTSEIKITY